MKKWLSVILVALMLSGSLVALIGTQNAQAAGLADSPWPMFHGNLRHTGLSPYDTSDNTGSPKWKYKTGGSVRSSPAIGSDGTIYVGSLDGYLYAFGEGSTGGNEDGGNGTSGSAGGETGDNGTGGGTGTSGSGGDEGTNGGSGDGEKGSTPGFTAPMLIIALGVSGSAALWIRRRK